MNFPFDPSWTLFLDRDGVINKRIMGGYVSSPDEFEFIEGVPQAISKFRNYFKIIVVVTNQQCVAKNIVSNRNLQEIHRYMQGKLMEQDTFIDAIYFAPELATDPENTRKPKPFMALEAQKNFPEIIFEKSLMIGDTDSDIKFGKNLGMKTVLILSEEKAKEKADWEFDSLLEFALQLEEK
ncbi:MAG: D-glycero-alpha-D-manno-heptose-1,7-bisphosphate 7-phosphatase [Bacteroidota bacterium]